MQACMHACPTVCLCFLCTAPDVILLELWSTEGMTDLCPYLERLEHSEGVMVFKVHKIGLRCLYTLCHYHFSTLSTYLGTLEKRNCATSDSWYEQYNIFILMVYPLLGHSSPISGSARPLTVPTWPLIKSYSIRIKSDLGCMPSHPPHTPLSVSAPPRNRPLRGH